MSHRKDLNKSERGSPKEHSYQVSWTSALRFQRRRFSNVNLSETKMAAGGHVWCRIGTIWTNLKEDHPRNIPANFQELWPYGFGGEDFQRLAYLKTRVASPSVAVHSKNGQNAQFAPKWPCFCNQKFYHKWVVGAMMLLTKFNYGRLKLSITKILLEAKVYGRRTKTGHNSSPEHFVLWWANKSCHVKNKNKSTLRVLNRSPEICSFWILYCSFSWNQRHALSGFYMITTCCIS